MSLAIDQPLRASDILEARDLKAGKIFLLKGRDGSALVIKGEGGVAGADIKAAAPILKAIDPSVRMKPLTASEILELKQFVRSWDIYVQFVEALAGKGTNLPLSSAEKQAMADLGTMIATYGGTDTAGRSNIAKMSAVRMATLGIVDKFNANGEDNPSWTETREIFAKFTKALNRSGGMEKLGQVLAGDFFIGNNDRFAADGGSGSAIFIHGEKKRLKCIVNLGNIILVEDAKSGKSRPSMLDYMDPSSSYLSNVSAPSGNLAQWPFQRLLDKKARQKLAQDLVDDLNYIIKPEKSLFGMNKLGGSRAATRVDDGIKQGIKAIGKSLASKKGQLTPLMKSYHDQMLGV